MNSRQNNTKKQKSKLMMSISGVRGIVGDSFTPRVVIELIAAFSKWLGNKGKVYVGRDTRITGLSISQLVSSTFVLNGINVIDIGIVPTPTVQLMVSKSKAKGGIVVTASHNPIQWNALKFIKADGTFLSRNEIEKVFKIYHDKDFNHKPFDKIGAYKEDFSAFKKHIDAVMKNIDTESIRKSKFKVLIDSVGGAGSKITPLLLRELGCEVTEINTEITGSFPRGTEPTPANIQPTAKKVKSYGCDIAFCQDPDADRLAIIDETGKPIGEDNTIALVVQLVLSKKKGPVVINQSSSRAIEDIAIKAKVPFYRTPVGEINVVDKMKEVKALIGGEGNGGVIDPAINMCRDSLVGIGYILELMAKTKKSISNLVKELPAYIIKKEAMPIIGDFDLLKERILEHFKSREKTKVEFDETDGLRINLPEEYSWLHFRSSNTEPILRLIGEAPDENKLNDLYDEVKRLLTK